MERFMRSVFTLLIITIKLSESVNFSGKDITSELFGSHNEDIFPVAYGDFNADKLTDVFAISRDQSDLLVYFSHEESPILRLGIRCVLSSISTSSPNLNGDEDRVKIVGVSPGDFNGDGLLDVLVTFKIPDADINVKVAVIPGNLTSLDCGNPISNHKRSKEIHIEMVQEPLMFDANGDMIMDLFGEVYELVNNTNVKRKKVWIFKQGGSGSWEELDFKPQFVKHGEHYIDDELSVPSSNAYVDTNGDFVPELVIITNSTFSIKNSTGKILYEVKKFRIDIKFTGDPEPSFYYLGKVTVDETLVTQIVGQSIFFDFNQNGKLFHVVPFSNKKSGKNSGLKVIPKNNDEGNSVKLPIEFTDSAGNYWHFLPNHPNPSLPSNYTSTIVLRVGDFNLDGYPDLIGILTKQEGIDRSTRAVLFENVACEVKPPSTDCVYPRTFKLNFEVFSHYENVTLATWFDVHEDGLVDVVLVRRTSKDTKHPYKDTFSAFAIQNSPDYDANFMKVMVLSPLNCPLCPQSNVPYGNIISGPLIEYKTTTQAGVQQTAVAAQLYRSSYMPLDLPYTIFGIGQSPNFIETLKVSVSPTSDLNFTQEWLQIIPNSQIWVVPTPLEKPWLWTAKLFLTPSHAVLDTFGVLVGFCGFIALIVGGLQYKERREDRKERLEEANRFHMM